MRAALLTTALLAAASCGGTEPEPAEAKDTRFHERAEQTAVAATAALMETLIGKLTTALGEGPPEHALDICSKVAQEITSGIEAQHGVSIRRTALRVRNPSNRPDAWERAWLEKAQADKESVPLTDSERVARPDGSTELRFVKTIYLQEMCLQCHGDPERMRPEVKALLEERYPEDEATGYATGDLRGIVSVRVPLGE